MNLVRYVKWAVQYAPVLICLMMFLWAEINSNHPRSSRKIQKSIQQPRRRLRVWKHSQNLESECLPWYCCSPAHECITPTTPMRGRTAAVLVTGRVSISRSHHLNSVYASVHTPAPATLRTQYQLRSDALHGAAQGCGCVSLRSPKCGRCLIHRLWVRYVGSSDEYY